MIRKQTVVIFCLFLASLIFWKWSTQEHPSIKPIASNSALPSSTAEDLISYQYDKQGVLLREFHAKSAFYYENKELTDAIAPVLLTYEKMSPAWRLTAPAGQLLKDEQVQLHGNILIQNQNPALDVREMRTTYLEMNLRTNQITTDKPLEIDGVDYHIQGEGLQADLNKNLYTILRQGHAIYQNPR